MKRPRPLLDRPDLARDDALLTTGDVARLLRVHPKHVYRLLRRGLPGSRVGGEWRFVAAAVMEWSRRRSSPEAAHEASNSVPAGSAPPLVAANGDVAVEVLLSRLSRDAAGPLGLVEADCEQGLDLLERGLVLAAGWHGRDVPAVLAGERLVFIHLVERQVGLAVGEGIRVRSLRQVGRWRIASRPRTAGVRSHFDRALQREGMDPDRIHAGAAILSSHREVACAVARGEADVGLASSAWANRLGLASIPLWREAYGLAVRARALGDPRVVRLCEIAQSEGFRKELGGVFGYRARRAGAISYGSPSDRGS